MNVSGLLNLLGNEKSSILGALPGGLGSVMGLNSGFDHGVRDEDEVVASGNSWLFPLLLLLALGAGIVFYMKNCTHQRDLPDAVC